jgi:hypothetical protein
MNLVVYKLERRNLRHDATNRMHRRLSNRVQRATPGVETICRILGAAVRDAHSGRSWKEGRPLGLEELGSAPSRAVESALCSAATNHPLAILESLFQILFNTSIANVILVQFGASRLEFASCVINDQVVFIHIDQYDSAVT